MICYDEIQYSDDGSIRYRGHIEVEEGVYEDSLLYSEWYTGILMVYVGNRIDINNKNWKTKWEDYL